MTLWQVSADRADGRIGHCRGPLVDMAVSLGKGGIKPANQKQEGDKASPAGVYPLRRVFFRPDRLPQPITALECTPLSPQMGWCDDPEHAAYNQLVRLPFGPSHEKLWRDDGLYDVVLVIGHNDDPIVAGAGSAIFVHCRRADEGPTDGCVAFARDDLVRLLRVMRTDDQFEIIMPDLKAVGPEE